MEMEARDKEVITNDLREAEKSLQEIQEKIRTLKDELKAIQDKKFNGYLNQYLSFTQLGVIYYFRAEEISDSVELDDPEEEDEYEWLLQGPGFSVMENRELSFYKNVNYQYITSSFDNDDDLTLLTKEEYKEKLDYYSKLYIDNGDKK